MGENKSLTKILVKPELFLQNKKILFLCPKFFGYEQEIKKELKRQGANVTYFDERPKNDFLTKALIRLNLNKLIYKRINEYYKKIIDSCLREKYDYLFLVTPETISKKHIELIKKYNPEITIITYMWDSFQNKRNSQHLIECSNRCFTFEKKDLPINPKLEFLPLFYISDYKKIGNQESSFQYDLAFIGTAHSDRYKLVINILNQLKEKRGNVFFYFYSPSKILFYWKKITDKNFRNIPIKDISFQSLTKSEIIDIVQKSKAMIDIEHSQQTGLTMRTIEMLGAKRKILTTNKDIATYDFYNKNNCIIVSREIQNINFDFIKNDWQEIPNEIYNKYSLENWIKRIFC